MKKLLMIMFVVLLLTGCGKNDEKSVTNSIVKKFNNSTGYKLDGELEITNNDDVYNYNVNVNYDKKNNYYKVVFVNQSNDFKQIILKNKSGVYLYTPSLNKSFKFSNNWPYKNSQIYLYDTIINDIKIDEKKTFSFRDNKYIFMTKVNYSNNSKLTKQKIVFDNNYKIKMIVIYNNKGETVMKLMIDKIKMSPKFKKNSFELDYSLKDDNKNVDKQTMSLDDVIYPLVIPSGTKLVDEKKVKKDNGQRVIMTYEGEKNFLLVEETIDVFNDYTTISTGGVPYQLLDTIGVMTNNSLSWTSGNLQYYLISDMMNQEELVEVAQSMVRVESFK